MMTDDMIRSYLMLHPETPIDMTEYLFPLRAVKQLLEAAVRVEREACANMCKSLSKDRGMILDEVFKEGVLAGADMCAETIRARGNSEVS